MNHAKATFFDSQVDEPWAGDPYTYAEVQRIHRVLALVGRRSGFRVLEPGCGTGRLTEILADGAGPDGFVLAADISEKMVDAARRRLGLRTNAQIQLGGIEDLHLEHSSFDLVLCHQVFPHFDDKPAALRRFAAWLKPMGQLAILHFINSARINDLHRKTDDSVRQDMIPEREEMSRMLKQAGFAQTVFEDDERGYLLVARLLLEDETQGSFSGTQD
jgi:demethylmenaquinone methyltransferase/2-methoxy-6-polyprenyl-1,4-benzoquinol methylase